MSLVTSIYYHTRLQINVTSKFEKQNYSSTSGRRGGGGVLSKFKIPNQITTRITFSTDHDRNFDRKSKYVKSNSLKQKRQKTNFHSLHNHCMTCMLQSVSCIKHITPVKFRQTKKQWNRKSDK